MGHGRTLDLHLGSELISEVEQPRLCCLVWLSDYQYLLAETGDTRDTLFASFIGTKQYKDMMADVNILQGAIFHDDAIEDTDEILTDGQKKVLDDVPKSLGAKPQQRMGSTKPDAHRVILT